MNILNENKPISGGEFDMPTGYTHEIYEGKDITGKEFILKCARAFGATAIMRDEPLNKEIPLFQPSTFYLDSLENEKKELVEYQNIVLNELQLELDQSFEQEVKRYKERVKQYSELEARYTKVLNEVKQWIPTTDEHIKLKNYAIEQLEQSIKHDCNQKYLTYPTKTDANEWLKYRVDSCKKNIEHYENEWNEEVERTNERNKWVKDLKESL